uniref:Protein kinase domain-containing protein n=1 Tax=Nelumbo nucifera TaxID=4432 RepID=A0A822YKX0_NELNU|nr:TPA_asm: hypothetical protein HUJ06_012013 [Nelumbo nucifera]
MSSSTRSYHFRLAYTTKIGSTIRYLPPESFQKQSVATTKAADVFSFGIVALKVASSWRAIDHTYPDEQIILLEIVDCRMDLTSLIHVRLIFSLNDPQSRQMSSGSSFRNLHCQHYLRFRARKLGRKSRCLFKSRREETGSEPSSRVPEFESSRVREFDRAFLITNILKPEPRTSLSWFHSQWYMSKQRNAWKFFLWKILQLNLGSTSHHFISRFVQDFIVLIPRIFLLAKTSRLEMSRL